MPDASDIILLLSEHEEAIGRLYAEYAGIFQEDEAFWMQFSKEEFLHAEWIRSLQVLNEKEEVLFTGRFNEAALQTSLKYIHNQIEKAREGSVTRIEALSISLSLENSLIEKKFFDAFAGDSAEVQRIRLLLVETTKKHRAAMQEAWSKNRTI